MQEIGLHELKIGERATVLRLHTSGRLRRRLLDIGLAENCPVECVGRAPSGSPIAFLIRGAVIALREDDCRNITVRRSETWD